MAPWSVKEKDGFAKSVKKAFGKDRGMIARLQKQIRKIAQDPLCYGDHKTARFKGLKSVRIGHHVLLFEVRGDGPADGEVILWSVKHHNDRDYDP